MTLSSMSIDEAIALACREVPELAVSLGIPVPHGARFKPRIGDDPYDRLERALWFDAAWEWIHHDCFLNRRRPGMQEDLDGWCVRDGKCTVILDRLPTKYHALAAAVLLAAGKPVP